MFNADCLTNSYLVDADRNGTLIRILTRNCRRALFTPEDSWLGLEGIKHVSGLR
jgi:hypothetical protein